MSIGKFCVRNKKMNKTANKLTGSTANKDFDCKKKQNKRDEYSSPCYADFLPFISHL